MACCLNGHIFTLLQLGGLFVLLCRQQVINRRKECLITGSRRGFNVCPAKTFGDFRYPVRGHYHRTVQQVGLAATTQQLRQLLQQLPGTGLEHQMLPLAQLPAELSGIHARSLAPVADIAHHQRAPLLEGLR